MKNWEGLTLKEAYDKAKEEEEEEGKFAVFTAYGDYSLSGAVTAFQFNGVRIWIPKSYRAIREELNMVALKQLKLKRMTMYNGKEAFFLLLNN